MSREFWVWPDHNQCRPVGIKLTMTQKNTVEPIHTITYDAYQAKCEQLERAEKRIEKLREALDKMSESKDEGGAEGFFGNLAFDAIDADDALAKDKS